MLMTFTEKVKALEKRLIFRLEEKGIPDPTKHIDNWMDHQHGVANILRRRKSPEYLIDAGLYHGLTGGSMAKPSGGEVATLFTPEELKDIIGEQALEVVYTYGYTPWMKCRHIDKMPESQLKKDVASLDIADVLDVMVTGWDNPRYVPEFIDSLFPSNGEYYKATPNSLAEMTLEWENTMVNHPHLNNHNKNY